MGRADYYAEGDWNAVCGECGRKAKASTLRRHWKGYYVCERCWEPRHPQDFVRAGSPEALPAWTQPPPEDTFIAYCTPGGLSCYADTATADCARPDYVFPQYNPLTDVTE